MDATTQSATLASFVQTMTERLASLARSLGAWVQAEPRTLQTHEEQVVRHLHDLGTALLTGLLALAPAPTNGSVPLWRPGQLPPPPSCYRHNAARHADLYSGTRNLHNETTRVR
jgi:hypothetical protein